MFMWATVSYHKFFTFESSASKPHSQKLGPNFSGMFLKWSFTEMLFVVLIINSTWQPRLIMRSDWLMVKGFITVKTGLKVLIHVSYSYFTNVQSEQFIYWIQCFYWLYFGVQVQQLYSKVLRQQDLEMHIVFDICTTSWYLWVQNKYIFLQRFEATVRSLWLTWIPFFVGGYG